MKRFKIGAQFWNTSCFLEKLYTGFFYTPYTVSQQNLIIRDFVKSPDEYGVMIVVFARILSQFQEIVFGK